MLQVAMDRRDAIQTQIEKGLAAPVRNLENEQMVASRTIDVTMAQRAFEAASIALSLFYRDTSEEPIRPGREQVPESLPSCEFAAQLTIDAATVAAMASRPEVRIYDLEFAKLDVDASLYKNKLLPKLSTSLSAEQSIGNQLYKDLGQLELKAGIEFEMPLQQRNARGKVEETNAKIRQTEFKLAFALDKIRNEILNYHSAILAATSQLDMANINLSLSLQLETIEQDRFALGATDLLSLQIREQAALKARIDQIDANAQVHKNLAEFLTAAAADFRSDADLTRFHPKINQWLIGL